MALTVGGARFGQSAASLQPARRTMPPPSLAGRILREPHPCPVCRQASAAASSAGSEKARERGMPWGGAPADGPIKRGRSKSAATGPLASPVPPGMEPCCALWAVLALLKGLKGQTSNTQPGVPSVLRSFQEDQFQGEWFVVGLAGSTHRKMDRFLLTPFTAVFEQNKNSHLEVSYAMTRGHRCVSWSYVLIPAAKPGGFSVESREEPEEVQVYDTDYSVFALMLFRRQSSGQSVVRVNLLCRMWTVQTVVLDKFVCLLQALGLSDDNVVFPDLTGAFPTSGPSHVCDHM
ncbi:epididymal-specific lipocalin-12 [Lutra lutra]|uniref:epididymal-specific lipocalin-12 n=1 Tax=Lutra lutra TaxID=9657 RepID=UPI001FD2CF89|nr:epididymal-specific lipocalin-12 [Lutra lutra]